MDMIRWLVDSKIFHNAEETTGMVTAISGAHLQSDLILTKYVMFQDDVSTITSVLMTPTPTVLYGTINFIKKVLDLRRFLNSETPVFAYGFSSDTEVLSYMTRLPQDFMLNQNYVMVPFVRFAEGNDFWYETFNTEHVFIRPNSGSKVFTGQVIPKKDFDYEINSLRQLTGVVDQTLIMVAPAINIKTESRFIIANKTVVHAIRYIDEGKNHYDTQVDPTPPNAAQELARKVAAWPWQVDHAYVVDIATLDDGTAKIVEFNAFCSAGFYTHDFKHIVNLINDTTIKVINDELVLER